MFGAGSGGSANLPEISNSLRFNGSNAYLSRTAGTPTSQNTWTYSGWVKRSVIGTSHGLFTAGGTASGIFFGTWNTAGDYLGIHNGGTLVSSSAALFRDPSSHLHVVVSSNGTAVTVYANNVSVCTYTGTLANLNTSAQIQRIGTNSATGQYLGGYISNVCFIDGQALTPSSFAYTDPNGQWRSLSKSALTALASAGGTNSFFLPFDNGATTTTLGYDASSKGNNWTLTNMVRDGSTSDCWSYDTPTNNFATLNKLDDSSTSVSNGALSVVSDASERVASTIPFPTTGKWYAEINLSVGSPASTDGGYGLIPVTQFMPLASSGRLEFNATYNQRFIRLYDGTLTNNGTNTAYASAGGTSNVWMIAYDADNGKVWFGRDGTWFVSGNPTTGTSPSFSSLTGTDWKLATTTNFSTGMTLAFNFGQRPVSGGAWDSAAGGYFRYTPPTGFKALCTKNLPVPTGAAKEPNKHFDVKTQLGSSVNTGANLLGQFTNFTADFVWGKDRTAANNHQLVDTVRGNTAVLQSNTTAAETTYTAPTSGDNCVAWGWKAGGAAVTNNAGSITSQVSANTSAGFSIVTYTGTGANATVGHGLGVAPKFIMFFNRSAVQDKATYHSAISPANFVQLDTTGAQLSATTYAMFGTTPTAPTSSVFSVGNQISTNGSTNNLVAYCFAEISGFSKIGSYTGNGSTDGPFVWCGFRPKFVMIKRATVGTGNWIIYDTARSTYNTDSTVLLANSSGLELTAAENIDILSNGFKMKYAGAGDTNTSGSDYIFYAVAESAFPYSNAR